MKEYTIISTTTTAPTQMVIDILDNSVVEDIKNLLSHVSGVGNISVRKPYYESEEFYQDLKVAETGISNGKGVRVDSKNDLDALFA